MGDMSYDADAWQEAKEGYLEVRRLLEVKKPPEVKQSPTTQTRQERIQGMLDKYQTAKSALVGSMVHCPTCGVSHQKTSYHKVFCSNGKTKRGGNCKDVYWNSVDEKRSERANRYMMTRNA